MASLKELLAKQDFEAILKQTTGKIDAEGLFYRVSAYFGLGRDGEGVHLLAENEDVLFEFHPLQYMHILIEARIALGEFEEAYEDAKRFAEKPYVSQEVEEYLRDLPAYIRAKERASFRQKEKAPSEIKKMLLEEEDDFTLLQLLGQIQKDPSYYQKELEALVEGERHPLVKTFALLLLISLKDEKEVLLKKNGAEYKLVPAKLLPPYTGEGFERMKSDISSYTKNTSLNDVAMNLMEEFIIAYYPEQITYPDEDGCFLPALFFLAGSYLQSKDGEMILEGFTRERQSQIQMLAKLIQNVLDANPPLKY